MTIFFESTVEVRQGCSLSPILFSLSSNDLPECFGTNSNPVELHSSKIDIFVFADDIIVKLSWSPICLQTSLNNIFQYCDTWKLNVKLKNSKIVTCNEKNSHTDRSYFYGNNTIEKKDNYEYLGITFIVSGKFTLAWRKNNFTPCKEMRAYVQLRQHFNIHKSVSIELLT